MYTKLICWIGCSWILLLTACTTTPSEKNKRPTIVTTTGMLADAARSIMGETADVIALMGPGVDPHMYKATEGDLQKLTSADVIIYNGLHLEGKMSEVLHALEKKNPSVYAFTNGIPSTKWRVLDATAQIYDPHVWFDVALWNEGVKALTVFLITKFPSDSVAIQRRSLDYQNQLDQLHVRILRQLDSIPVAQRVLITAHDAFGYFGQAYHIEVRGLQGISTVADFGLNDVSQLVQYITSRKIKAVFIESSISEQSIRAVVEGCTAKGHPITIGGTLYSDAMGSAGTPAGTYIGMVEHNVHTICQALR
ncbi:MAG: zinc ABC transporter substrate-binding protein [Cytophagaceae bacterium]|nr:zinc ABC transporter substrate-binding protein [Cytophagaceae bacterium]